MSKRSIGSKDKGLCQHMETPEKEAEDKRAEDLTAFTPPFRMDEDSNSGSEEDKA